MPLELYYWPAIAGCRAVLMVGEALGLKFSLHHLDVLRKEHLSPEFIAINHMKTVPALKDDSLVIFESYAICTYLINKYAKDDFLYPKDPVRRAKVDQFLFFASGPLTKNLLSCLDPRQPTTAFSQAHESLSAINTQLGRAPYIAGYHITVADFMLTAILSAAEALLADFDKYTNITAWLQKCKADIPGYRRHNEPGLQQFVSLYNSKKKGGTPDADKNKLSVPSGVVRGPEPALTTKNDAALDHQNKTSQNPSARNETDA